MAGVKGQSGRRKTPTEILRLRGSFKKDPQRLRERASEPPAVEGKPEPPAYLDRTGKASYRSVVKSLQELSCLSKTDKHAVELFAIAYSALRKANEFKDIVSLTNTCGRLLAQMGLSPSARANLKMNPSKEQIGVESKSFLTSYSASVHLHNISCPIVQFGRVASQSSNSLAWSAHNNVNSSSWVVG